MKKLLIFGIVAVMLVMTAGAVTFTDVPESAWYYKDVMNAVEIGIVNGKTATEYKPNDNLTYAETFKLAACMHQLATQGAVTLKNGQPWYSEYAEYCFTNGIIDLNSLMNFEDIDVDAKITRSGYMAIFANALPDDMLPIINYVPDGSIPDVAISASYAPGVYKLYRAGILQGSDAEHNCKPFENIKRSEVAAIITRMMDKSKRVRFDMGTPEKTEPFVIEKQPSFESDNSGKKYSATVKVKGGKEPYNYSWQVKEETTWYDFSVLLVYEPDISTLFTGYDTDTFTFFTHEGGVDSMPFRCKVTDSLGYSVITDTAILSVEKTNEEEVEEETEKETDAASRIKVTVSGTKFDFKTGEVLKVGVQAEGGTEPYKYSWLRLVNGEWENDASGSILPDGTYDPSYELYDSRIKSPGEEFVIKCVVADKNGNVGESEVVTITTPDFILEKGLPQFTDMCVGEDVTLSVKVNGGKEPYTYKWYFGEFVISTKNYQMTPKFGNSPEVTFRMTGDYLPPSDNVKTSFRCDITDADGNQVITSTGVNDVTPKDMPLTIVQQARRITTTPRYGYDLEFDVDVYGGKQPYTYEWFYESRYRQDVTAISLNTLPQTQVRRFNSELYINLREETTILGKEIYCVVTDAEGTKVTSEKVAVCPDFFMMKFDTKSKTDSGETVYAGEVISGELKSGDKIGFNGYFDGKHEYITGTVDMIILFGKNLDKAEAEDKNVGVVLKNIRICEKMEDLEQIIGSGYKNYNLAFNVLPTVLSVKVGKERYSTTPGKSVHLNAYANGGSESYKKLEWFKEVDGEWVSIGRVTRGAQCQEGFLMQHVYHGEKEPTSFRAKCVVTDSYGNTAESDIIELVTSDIGFETVFPAETKVSVGETVTFSVKPKGGKGPYTYKWYVHTGKNDNSSSSFEYLENNPTCIGHDSDTVTFEVISRYVTTSGQNGSKVTLCCQATDSEGAYAVISTVLVSK